MEELLGNATVIDGGGGIMGAHFLQFSRGTNGVMLEVRKLPYVGLDHLSLR